MTRAQLADVEWEFIEPYLPIGEYGPHPVRLRQQFEGVLWRFRTGGQWREMPAEFGAWSTVHNRFRQWRDAGVSTEEERLPTCAGAASRPSSRRNGTRPPTGKGRAAKAGCPVERPINKLKA